jgi:DNA transposition AAA+ family ATPase
MTRVFEQNERSAAADGEYPAQRIARLQKAVGTLIKSAGWSNAEASRRSDISAATFSEWLRGTYKGNYMAIADKIERWLVVEETAMENKAAMLIDPGYVETSLTKQVVTALHYAQNGPSMVLITMGSGLGKTMAMRWYASNRPHAHRVVIEPLEGKPNTALRKIAGILGLTQIKTNSELTARVAERLRRDGGRQPLLMIDEAQNLRDDAVNQLRFLLDEAGCGLALAGNEDLMTRYGLSATREGFGQIHRRVGMRIHVKTAPANDVDVILNAYQVHDEKVRRLAHQIAARAGGIGQAVDTLKLASTLAYGAGREVSADDVRAAWQNRSSEDMR